MSEATKPTSTIIAQARQFVLNLHNQKANPKLLYHSYAQTAAIAEQVEALSKTLKASPEAVEIARLAAYFHQTGYLGNYNQAQSVSGNFAKQFLEKINYPKTKMQHVLRTIEATSESKANTVPEAMLLDAMQYVRYGEQYNEWSGLLRIERELVLGEEMSKQAWQELELQELLRVQFYTPHGKTTFAPLVGQNIVKQKNRVDKAQASEKADTALQPVRPFENIAFGGSDRGAQTFFRTNYRMHMDLSAIADNKANIMISVNSILISVLITMLTWRNITQTNPSIMLPAVVFLMTALVSLVFAILSSRPKITNVNKKLTDLNSIKKNITFFGNFVRLPLEQYEKVMDEVLREDELLYGNMSRDLYYLGQVLAKKYHRLKMSYDIFMIGFVLAVLAFIISLFVN